MNPIVNERYALANMARRVALIEGAQAFGMQLSVGQVKFCKEFKGKVLMKNVPTTWHRLYALSWAAGVFVNNLVFWK